MLKLSGCSHLTWGLDGYSVIASRRPWDRWGFTNQHGTNVVLHNSSRHMSGKTPNLNQPHDTERKANIHPRRPSSPENGSPIEGGPGATPCTAPRQVCPRPKKWLWAQLAFKNSMIHEILQFTPFIAFRCVLHRYESRDIHCRESLHRIWAAHLRGSHAHTMQWWLWEGACFFL